MKNGNYLNIGDCIDCAGQIYKIVDVIGGGNQGKVYKVELNGKNFAFKYCFHIQNKEKIIKLINNPMESNMFIWPLYLYEDSNGFGYIMDLIPEHYMSITDYFNTPDVPIKTLIKVCINICQAIHELHSSGKSYKDISETNVKFDKTTGEILFFDCDNITVNKEKTDMMGTPGYIAPEMIENKNTITTRETDLYALAVLLFKILFKEHPLEGNFQGKCPANYEDDEWEKEIYGKNGCFIFKDESDLDKYIVPEQEDKKSAWQEIPSYLKEAFRESFDEGLRCPKRRITSDAWESIFIRLYNDYYCCAQCGNDCFYNEERLKKNQGQVECLETDCSHKAFFPLLKVDQNYFIILSKDKELLAGTFNIAGPKSSVSLIVDEENDNFRLLNKSNRCIKYVDIESKKEYIINPGEYTPFIKKAGWLTFNLKDIFNYNEPYKTKGGNYILGSKRS